MKWTRIGVAAFIGALAIGLALSLGLWGQWTASAQDTFTVNDDTAPATDGCDTPDFETEDIEDAIDSGLVADGDTLMICEGTYNPPTPIEVTKDLTIEGRAAASRDNIAIQGTAGNDGFVISVDGVTIRHLKLTGTGAGADRGIAIQSTADNNTIQDMEITAWNIGVITGDAQGNVIETSDIHTNADAGIQNQSGENTVIRNNEITGNTNNGISVEGEDGALVDGNTLSGNGLAQIQVIGRTLVSIVRNQIDTTASTSDGIYIGNVPATALIEIGGSAAMANTFTGPFGAPDFYVKLHCSAQDTVDATYNWWGATTRIDIANRIFNDEDDPTPGVECAAPDDVNGAVVFHPWATGPAPTATPSPTPTATGTPTPTATATATATPPGATRTIDLSPQGWHDLAWSGAAATDPGTALACIAGKYSIAYAWEGPTVGFKRYVEGCAIPGICNMAALNKYDTMLVSISAAGVTCVMPVAP
jgi:parallel beta-helix repeat protein